MNDRNAQEITRPSRQSVVEKEPCFIYQNNNQLFQNSTQQVDLTSSIQWKRSSAKTTKYRIPTKVK